MPGRTTSQTRPSPRLWLGVFGVVLVAGVVAVLASRGGDDNVATTDGSAGSAAETRPVQVTGPPLPRYDGEPDPAAGRPIPRVAGATFDGSPITIEPDGRPKLMVFVAHWCPHCQREIPRLTEYLQDNPLPAELDLVTVATATTADRPNYPPSEWLARERWPGRTVLADTADGRAAAALGLSSFPFFVATDNDGNVVARASGELTTDRFAELVRLATG